MFWKWERSVIDWQISITGRSGRQKAPRALIGLKLRTIPPAVPSNALTEIRNRNIAVCPSMKPWKSRETRSCVSMLTTNSSRRYCTALRSVRPEKRKALAPVAHVESRKGINVQYRRLAAIPESNIPHKLFHQSVDNTPLEAEALLECRYICAQLRPVSNLDRFALALHE